MWRRRRSRGFRPEKLRGTVQNDILKEYQAQHAWVYPPEPALRLIVDMFEWASEHAPKYNPISISGYHIREAGSTATQELAFTLGNGFEYVERGIARGLDVDSFAPRLSFFFDVHNDFFEEVAKFRAARRIWARHMKEKYGATNPDSWRLRTHAQTAGVSLTAQQPENNIVRVAYQALAAVLGGTQSLHTNSMDETLALPTEKAVRIALRTQQILAYETGVPNTMDPSGRFVLSGGPHQPTGSRGRGDLPAGGGDRRRGSRNRDRLVPEGDRRLRLSAADGGGVGAAEDRGRDRVHRRVRFHRDRHPLHLRRRSKRNSGPGWLASGPSGMRNGSEAPWPP